MFIPGFVIFIVALVVLDIAAHRWGVDSTDGVNSLEWERRHWWHGIQ